jgi:hypothetical protein
MKHSGMLVGGLLALTALTACSSAGPAPTGAQPPGPALTLSDGWLTTAEYTAWVPSGWRVVQVAPAPAPLEIVLVSPDEAMTITLGQPPLTSAAGGDVVVHTHIPLGGDRALALRASSSPAAWTRLAPVYRAVRARIRPAGAGD